MSEGERMRHKSSPSFPYFTTSLCFTQYDFHAMSSPVSRQNAFQIQSLFFFFQIVPHLVEFKDNSICLGFRGMWVLIAEVSYPLQDGAGCGV